MGVEHRRVYPLRHQPKLFLQFGAIFYFLPLLDGEHHFVWEFYLSKGCVLPCMCRLTLYTLHYRTRPIVDALKGGIGWELMSLGLQVQ